MDEFKDAGMLQLQSTVADVEAEFSDLSFAVAGSAEYLAATVGASTMPSAAEFVARRLEAHNDGVAAGATTTAVEVVETVVADPPAAVAVGVAGVDVLARDDALLTESYRHLFRPEAATDGATGALAPKAAMESLPGTADDGPDGHLPIPDSFDGALRQFHVADLAAARGSLPPSLRAMMEGGLRAAVASSAGPAGAGAGALPTGAAASADDVMQALQLRPDAAFAGSCGAGASAPADAEACPLNSVGAAGAAGPAGELKLATAQVHSVPGDVAANVTKVTHLLRAAATAGVHLLVFPETFLQGYHIGPALMRSLAIEMPSPAQVETALAAAAASGAATTPEPCRNPVLQLCVAAAAVGVAAVVPFAELGPADAALLDAATPPVPGVAGTPRAVYNTSLLIDSDGRIVAHYRKSHLWGCAYEKKLFTPGPGPASPFARHAGSGVAGAASEVRGAAEGALPSSDASTATAASTPAAAAVASPRRWRWDPFYPSTLRGFPHVPVGLMVCFDVEFPEPARLYASRGAKVVVASMASGDSEGFSSRFIIPTRAAESHVTVVYSNFPSQPLPGFRDASGGAPLPAPADAIYCQYSGGSVICSPTGRPFVALPPYVSTANAVERDRRLTAATVVGQPYFCADETLALTLAAHAAAAGACSCGALAAAEAGKAEEPVAARAARVHAGLTRTLAATLCAPCAGAAGSPPSAREGWAVDEVVIVARLNPLSPEFVLDEERNPYLLDRRLDLFNAGAPPLIAGAQ
jgi:predicted amidohydrolase